MHASVRDLRSHTKELLDAARRGERVIITYRDIEYVELIPVSTRKKQVYDDDAFGMWADNEKTAAVDDFVNQLRMPRYRAD